MGTIIAVGVVAIVIVAIVMFVVMRVYRAESGTERPRRRDVRRAIDDAQLTRRTLLELRDVVDRYRSVVVGDAVGSALVDELTDLIRQHDRQIMENDK